MVSPYLVLDNIGVAPGCKTPGPAGWEAQVGGVRRRLSVPQAVLSFRRYAQLHERVAVILVSLQLPLSIILVFCND